MIFLNKIETIPSKSEMIIPYTLLTKNYKGDFLVIDGGIAKDIHEKKLDGGFASTKATLSINGGFAKFDGTITLNIKITHTITREVFTYKVQPIEINNTYFKAVFVFDVIPPLGQYEIDVTEGDNYLYSGLLQIGDIENTNKVYNKIIKYNIYE